MQAHFIIRTLNHIICLPLFNIYNWFISQNPERLITSYVYFCLIFTIGSFRKIQIFFTDLQQTVCGSNWFISQNPDIFFFISQNPDFINVVENVDFAKSRFFLFRRIQIFFYFAESIFRNFAKSIFRKIQLAH